MPLHIRVHERLDESSTLRWATRNLSVDDGQGGIVAINGNTYYTADAARRVADKVQGFRLPTHSECNAYFKNRQCKFKRVGYVNPYNNNVYSSGNGFYWISGSASDDNSSMLSIDANGRAICTEYGDSYLLSVRLVKE